MAARARRSGYPSPTARWWHCRSARTTHLCRRYPPADVIGDGAQDGIKGSTVIVAEVNSKVIREHHHPRCVPLPYLRVRGDRVSGRTVTTDLLLQALLWVRVLLRLCRILGAQRVGEHHLYGAGYRHSQEGARQAVQG